MKPKTFKIVGTVLLTVGCVIGMLWGTHLGIQFLGLFMWSGSVFYVAGDLIELDNNDVL